ncbi:MAG: iron-sulfur cluster insertion protein ErpA [Nitrosopumilaceae archaeon]
MTDIVFTDAAAIRTKQLLVEENNDELMLRVAINGGGCSGFKYGFSFDIEANEDDTVIEKQGVKLLIDPVSGAYLHGAEIDFVRSIEGDAFVIKNPNATTKCGCGSSFGV